MNKHTVERIIVWVMTTLFAAHGAFIMIKQEAQIRGRPPRMIYGADAVFYGLANFAIGMVFLSFAIQWKWPNMPKLYWGWGIAWSVICLLSYAYTLF